MASGSNASFEQQPLNAVSENDTDFSEWDIVGTKSIVCNGHVAVGNSHVDRFGCQCLRIIAVVQH